MTLSTLIYVLDPIPAREVFDFCRGLIGATDRHTWKDRPDSDDDGTRTMNMNPGQGLPAWLLLHYRPDTPLHTPEQATEHDDHCDQDCNGEHHPQPCWLNIDFDTGYSYRDDHGRGCGHLHADYISRLGLWLDARGVRWKWRNEFTGDIHDGYDQLDGLRSEGSEASTWYRTSVMPALPGIIAHIANGEPQP